MLPTSPNATSRAAMISSDFIFSPCCMCVLSLWYNVQQASRTFFNNECQAAHRMRQVVASAFLIHHLTLTKGIDMPHCRRQITAFRVIHHRPVPSAILHCAEGQHLRQLHFSFRRYQLHHRFALVILASCVRAYFLPAAFTPFIRHRVPFRSPEAHVTAPARLHAFTSVTGGMS